MHKSKFISWMLRAAGGTVALLFLIVALGSLCINLPFLQEEIIDLATDAISEKLDTDVEIERVKVNLLSLSASIQGIELEDQQGRKMLQVGKVWGSLRVLPLLRGKVVLKEGLISNVNAMLLKPSKEAPANYQFVIDSLKPKKKTHKKSFFSIDIRHAQVRDIKVTYNDQEASIDKAVYTFWRDEHRLTIDQSTLSWERKTKKGMTAYDLNSGVITIVYHEKGEKKLNVAGMTIKTDNHLPRKNTGKPHRGWFDTGHFDIVADMEINIGHISSDSVNATLTKCCAKDSVTGMDFRDITMNIAANKQEALLANVSIKQGDTQLNSPLVVFRFPDKEADIGLRYYADSIKGRVVLKDISRPFALVLHQFKLPLNLSCSLSGNNHSMTFKGIDVSSDDRKFTVNATGIMRNMGEKEKLNLHFDVHKMSLKPGIKKQIISQFPIKKFLMYQYYALGNIFYHGDFEILWRKEKFRGVLNTDKGNINFDFTLDENDKYLTGTASTDSLKLGELFDMKNLSNIACSVSYNIDYSKKRTAEIRKEKGGKLPIGTLQAYVKEVGYKKAHIHNVYADIKSDGAMAEGDLTVQGSLTDLVLKFSFTNTEQMQKVKVKPGLKFRHVTGQDKPDED